MDAITLALLKEARDKRDHHAKWPGIPSHVTEHAHWRKVVDWLLGKLT